MSRRIIGKVALKYGDNVVFDGIGFNELLSDTDSTEVSNAQCLMAFFQDSLALGFDIPFDEKHYNSAGSLSNVHWRNDYTDPDRPPNTGSSRYRIKVGDIAKIDDNIAITMLNIKDGINQATGEAIAIADGDGNFVFYTPKQVTFEIHKLTQSDVDSKLIKDWGWNESLMLGTEIEDIYTLIQPLLVKNITALDTKGFAQPHDDGQKIMFYANAVQYIKEYL